VDVEEGLGADVEVRLGEGVEVGLGEGVEVGSGTAIAIGSVDAARAVTCEGPNGVNASATEMARATETAGWPTTVRTRERRAASLFKHFTLGNSIGWPCGD